MTTISVGWSTIESPGGDCSREYGSMPPTSPPCHSMIRSRPLARSTCSANCPDSTMNRPSTNPAARAVRISPGSRCRSRPWAATHSSSSRGAPPMILWAARRSIKVLDSLSTAVSRANESRILYPWIHTRSGGQVTLQRSHLTLLVAAVSIGGTLLLARARPTAQSADPLPVMSKERALAFVRAAQGRLDYLPGEVLIKFRSGVSQTQQQAALSSLRSRPSAGNLQWIGEIALLRDAADPDAPFLARVLS